MKNKRLVYLYFVSALGLVGGIYLGATDRVGEGMILTTIANLAIGIDFGFMRLEALMENSTHPGLKPPCPGSDPDSRPNKENMCT